MVITPCSTNVWMTRASLIEIGFGEATTLRQPRPASSLNVTEESAFI